MPKKRFQPEEVIGKLRHADVLLGRRMSRVCGRAPFPDLHLPKAIESRWGFEPASPPQDRSCYLNEVTRKQPSPP
jgi:hypothetical protein